MSDLMADLAGAIAEAAKALFADLPEGEIDDTEPLGFAVVEDVGLVVRLERTGAQYVRLGASSVRAVQDGPEFFEVTAFQAGLPVASVRVPKGTGAWWSMLQER